MKITYKTARGLVATITVQLNQVANWIAKLSKNNIIILEVK
mgnify:CR=1 FL=1|jgi:hypothetical protein